MLGNVCQRLLREPVNRRLKLCAKPAATAPGRETQLTGDDQLVVATLDQKSILRPGP